MARWEDLAGYIRNTYKIKNDDGTFLELLFRLDNHRSQVVMVSRAQMPSSSQDWAIIASPFGSAAQVDLQIVLREASEYVAGGVVQYADMLCVKHAVPLGTLDVDEFEEPFELVMRTADALEAKFFGGDRF
ncbi:hypothetical protein [Luteipulveratus flavus]|uniref:Uncharacterized protein n=1 Tax=Luteipulveratus flavus TaxID=3031728 RepID=A0ABT6C3G7_9MICO|nr:hypothetical protein [Luteipulveratus sp. YIM 133296]MDF8263098.1 hypothetical protein [Luteipulveratus sp. YIM 133296]